MIHLTRLSGQAFALNACLIEQIEALPDTTITLLSGKKIVVRESLEDVAKAATAFFEKASVNAVYRARELSDDV